MSTSITFPLPDGASYIIPAVDDDNWGQNVTDFLIAIPNGVPPRSGSFILTGELSFGPSFGLSSLYYKSLTTNPASTGLLRLAKTDTVTWRNNANSGNLSLGIDGLDQLTFNGSPVGSGVGSITGTANQIIASSPTGAVTLSTPQDIAPASSPTFASLTLSSPLTVPNGGTGDSSFTAYSVICGGTTSGGALQNVAGVGSSGQFLQSQGAGMLPIWANASGTGTVNSGTAGEFAYYSTSSNIVSSSGIDRTNPTFSGTVTGLTLNATQTTNQLTFTNGGGGNQVRTINVVATTNASTVVQIPIIPASTTADVVLTETAQTVNATKTFSSALVLPTHSFSASGGTITADATITNTVFVTVDAAATINGPTGGYDGQKITFRLAQDGTGHTVTFSTGSGNFRFGTDITSFTASAANLTDYVGAIWNSGASRWDIVSTIKGF